MKYQDVRLEIEELEKKLMVASPEKMGELSEKLYRLKQSLF